MSSKNDHYNKSGMIIFLLSMTGSVFFFIYVAFIHPGVTGIDKVIEPLQEPEVLSRAKIKAVDPETIKNPWVFQPGLVAAGAQIYASTCASCHGKKGMGDGVAAIPGVTRNLVIGDWKVGKGSSQDLFKVLQKGISGTTMASFKDTVSKNKRWALVHFIRSITRNKADDDPAVLETFAKTAE